MSTKNNFSDWEFTPVIDKVVAFQLVDGDTQKMKEYCPELKIYNDKIGNTFVEIEGNTFILLDTWWLIFFDKKPIRILNNIQFWKSYVKN
jgi:hypothetical protein